MSACLASKARLEIGPEISGLSDQEIIDLFNKMLREKAQLAAESKHVAVEVPLGGRPRSNTSLGASNGRRGAECCVAGSKMKKASWWWESTIES